MTKQKRATTVAKKARTKAEAKVEVTKAELAATTTTMDAVSSKIAEVEKAAEAELYHKDMELYRTQQAFEKLSRTEGAQH